MKSVIEDLNRQLKVLIQSIEQQEIYIKACEEELINHKADLQYNKNRTIEIRLAIKTLTDNTEVNNVSQSKSKKTK